MKKKSYLNDYERFLKEGLYNGLCHEYGYSWDILERKDPLFELFIPQTRHEGLGQAYWAQEPNDSDSGHIFNELRQNIVLFMAAMNNEL